MACQHFPDDQTLRLQAGAGEDDVIHLPSGLDRVVCERQEEEEDADVAVLLLIRQASNIPQRRSVRIKDTHSKICYLVFALYSSLHIKDIIYTSTDKTNTQTHKQVMLVVVRGSGSDGGGSGSGGGSGGSGNRGGRNQLRFTHC